MNSICDDKVLQLVGYELSRIGLFTAISEIEQSAVLIYAKLRKAYIEEGSEKFVLNSDIKDDTYYNFLSNAVIVDIFSRSRLKKVRNSFELNSALCLLDGYLHKLSTISNTVKFKARDIFNDIILDLPMDMNEVAAIHVPPPPHTPSDHHLDAIRYATNVPCQFMGSQTCSEEPDLCTNCEGDECYDTVNMTVEYAGVCYGFKVDPIILGCGLPIEKCDVQVFKNFLTKGYRLFKSKAKEIFEEIHEAYSGEDDD